MKEKQRAAKRDAAVVGGSSGDAINAPAVAGGADGEDIDIERGCVTLSFAKFYSL